ncbi:hypothetical protein FHN55_15655 [Streptomyces sp. NP160]|uniref:hypothetical protein n=1 Tax=Streptomyces sp. NP160 TaxID=2586637 RepID=UPI0011197A2B|nr:hypothetical protein [Streptomyces sp. NP160]TNM63262.1 hypothetical protein FHN55_15655 [Streptomyces sp. NP160]
MLLRAVAVLLVPWLLVACAPAAGGRPDPVVVRTTTPAAEPVPAAACAPLRVPVGLLAPRPGDGLRLLVLDVAS